MRSNLRLQKGLTGIFTVLFMTFSTPLFAKTEKWYQVEVLVFENNGNISQEEWPVSQNLPSVSRAISLRPSPDTPFSFSSEDRYSILPSHKLSLNTEKKQIQSDPSLKVLLHEGWVQPITSGSAAETVHFGGKAFQASLNQAEGFSSQPKASSVEGIVKLSLGRFLNIETDIVYKKAVRALTPPSQASLQHDSFQRLAKGKGKQGNLYNFRLNQTRKIRSDEINYFDHPIFGVLVKITPIKASTQSTKEVEGTPAVIDSQS